MKKFFAWVMALAMILTMMPVMDEHNHAQAAGPQCGECFVAGKVCEKFESKYGFGTTCKCGHLKKYHCEDHNPYKDGELPGDCMNPGRDTLYCNTCKKYTYVDHEIDKSAHTFKNGFCINEDEDGNKCTAHLPLWQNGVCVRVDDCTDNHGHIEHNFKVDVDSIVDGTCMAPKTWELVCDVCGASETETGEKDPTNHSWKNDGTCANGCDAKCEHETYVDNKCTVCGCPDHEHPDEAFTDTLVTPGTCVAGAVYTRTYACGATETITDEIDPDAHTWAPTGECVNTGCDQACPHNWVDGVCTECTYTCKHPTTTQTTTVPGNCKNVGSADLICDECGEVADTVELPIDEDNHKWVVFSFGAGYCVRCNEINVNYEDFEDMLPEKEPIENPCEEHQWASLSFGAWYCTKCGATATDIKPLDPEICDHADTYIEVVEAATCRKEGSAKEICDICEEVLDDNVVLPIDPDAHDWIVFSFGAGFCRLCSHISVDDSLFEEPEDPMDSCEHNWLQVGPGWFCPNCGGVTNDENVVNPPVEEPEEPKYCEDNEHQWASLSFGAWYCIKCGASATDIKPLEPEICNHADTYIDVTTPATCVATGLGNKMCDICETLLEEGVEVAIDPDAHKWGADENGNACCLLCGLCESELPKEEPCEHDWIFVGPGWYCYKCDTATNKDPFAPEVKVLLGDVNDDGVVDGRDEVRLMKYLVGQGVSINKANADLNGDGVIDGRDEIRLLYRLL